MPSSPRRRKAARRLTPEARQEQILDTTMALAVRDGYGATTMQSVAREAGVTRPVVYEFYRDRTELLQDLLAREIQKAFALSQNVFAAVQRGETLNETMSWTLTEFLNIVAQAPESWRLVLLPPAGAPPEVQATITSARAAILAQIQRNLEQLPGATSAEVDIELLAFTLLAGCEVGARRYLADPELYSIERLSASMTWIREHIRFEWSSNQS
ncbi:TetR/AcrR family transcriptional regulator [Mycolicibacterium septicum DSM 44393]|uniref:TetR/AcrR family transcriptional regulator n=1 Tax=Mycolicibacterium septicum DSM 44393 TaxID=1341646 RepID=A0A7X6RUY7_9MYCO|nr:TetR/AcrR family transcriptional regulator [Mycolicibacterium septicum]NKZ10839.1 TetR/AcrR family transcriptional regulator [Mycolicibacterium septicum DSM 44393]